MGITQRVIHYHDDGNFICKEEDDIKILLSRTATKPQDIIAVDPTIEVGHDLSPGHQSRPQEMELDPFRMWRAYNDQINYSDGTLVFSQERPSNSGGNVAKDLLRQQYSTVVQIPSCCTIK